MIDFAQELRDELGFGMRITSEYGCPNHAIEKRKERPGTHARGIVFDVGLQGDKAKQLTELLLQKNRGRFIHADIDQTRLGLFWSYWAFNIKLSALGRAFAKT